MKTFLSKTFAYSFMIMVILGVIYGILFFGKQILSLF